MEAFFKGMFKGLLLVGIIAAIFYAVSYKSWINKDLDDIVVDYKDEEGEIKPTDKDDKVDYKKYYEKVNYKFLEDNFGTDFYNIYYKNEPFTDEFYLYLAVVNIISKNLITECNYSTEISSMEVEWKAKEIFGNIDFKKISYVTSDEKLSIIYDQEKDVFVITTKACSGFDYTNGGIYTTATDYSLTKDAMYILEKAMYLNYNYDFNGNLIFSYHGGINPTDTVIANNIDLVDYSKVPTYRLVFKKVEDTYYFSGVQRQ